MLGSPSDKQADVILLLQGGDDCCYSLWNFYSVARGVCVCVNEEISLSKKKSVSIRDENNEYLILRINCRLMVY